MDRRTYATARRSFRGKFLTALENTKGALRRRIRRAARKAGWNRKDPNWEVRIEKNVYRQLRLRRLWFIAFATTAPEVRDPHSFVARQFAKIELGDTESLLLAMTAKDWLRV